jgi:aldose 1-epimerase
MEDSQDRLYYEATVAALDYRRSGMLSSKGPMTRHEFPALVLATALICIAGAPAAAQRYTAKQDGEVIALADTTTKMNVEVVTSLGKAWKVQVNGQNLVRTSASLDAFVANSGLNGIPLLAPFANRLDETAFYANGKKYTFDLGLGNVRGPIPGTGFVNGSKAWQLVEFKADGKSAWVTCRLDFYKIPEFIKQFPFAHTITLTYRVSEGSLEVHTRLDNLSSQPMPATIGFHPIYELPDGNRDDWTVSVDAKTHWIEIPQRLPTGETQPIEEFFNADKDRTAIKLKNYALIDDVFTDLIRDTNGRATMRLLYNGKELDETLGPKFKTVLLWSTPLGAGGGGGGRGGSGGGRGGNGGGRGGAQTGPVVPSGPFPVDPAQGEKTAPPAVPPVAGAASPTTKGFIAFEPMVGITNALNLAQKGTYNELQMIPPGGYWEESFWVTAKGY